MRPFRRLPVRIRLAVISAGLTFAILLLFGVVIGIFAGRQVRTEFDDELLKTAADLQQKLPVRPTLTGLRLMVSPEAIGRIARLAIASPARLASRVPPSTPAAMNSQSFSIVDSMCCSLRPYCT